ncbi:MAG TPA: glycosyltransferase [Ignavibacteria bacterium]|nr:glycosyltransferase [Ignavibacteria bacterium]
MIKVSVIISFYNKIDYLKLVLSGFERQSFRDFEIIIADDGSNQKVVDEIEKLSLEVPFQFIHLWQEDKEFRKNKILNRAIVDSRGEILIFIDGDCIPHSEFIKEHVNYSLKRVCLTGRRVNLSEKLTIQLTSQKVKEGFLENHFLKLAGDGLFGQSFDIEKGFYFRSKFLRNIFNRKKRGLLGCNFSIYKDDFLNINGFDERYETPSIGEDSDVQFRLELTGCKINSLNNIAIQYHLYHKIQTRLQKNLDLFEEVKKLKIAFTDYGINNRF